jgi:hypothetical protein
MIPLSEPEQTFAAITHQGKAVKVGDQVVVHHAGTRITVTVDSIIKRDNHFWVGYDNNQHFCPWPMVSVI